MGTFLIILGLYLLYNFIVYLVIPVYRTTKKVQQQFRNMQQSQHETSGGTQPFDSFPRKNAGSNHTAGNPKDYIEFEEIKD